MIGFNNQKVWTNISEVFLNAWNMCFNNLDVNNIVLADRRI